MKNNQIYKFDATLKKLVDETGYKHIALESQEGERIVAYNPTKTKLSTKWDEIRRRILAQPDGFYKILATTALGGKTKPDVYIIQKGDIPTEVLKEEKTPVVQYIPQPKSKEENTRDKILSLDEALNRIKELSELRVENDNLKKQVADNEEYIEQLEKEIEELESKPLSEGAEVGGAQKWLENTIPAITPFVEQYFATKNREIALKEKMLDRKKTKKPIIVNSNRKRQSQQDQVTFMTMDITNEQQLNQLFDELEVLDDAKFDEAFATIAEQRPELAQIIADEFELELGGGANE